MDEYHKYFAVTISITYMKSENKQNVSMVKKHQKGCLGESGEIGREGKQMRLSTSL